MSTPNASVSSGTITTPPPSPVTAPSIPASKDPTAMRIVNSKVFTKYFWLAVQRRAARSGCLKHRQLYMQEFFRTLSEIIDHQTQIARQPGHVVVQFRVGEEFSGGAFIRVQFRGSVAYVGSCISQIVVQRVIVQGLAERALTCAHVIQHPVALVHKSFRAVIHGGGVNQPADGALLLLDGHHHVV